MAAASQRAGSVAMKRSSRAFVCALSSIWGNGRVLDDLDADGRDAGAEHVQIRRGLAFAHRPALALFVAVSGLYCHWRANADRPGRS
jgi:hypothetical protein